ncbi:hypothetical protein AAC387_Pa12g1116 [Persea americana]
MAMRVDSFAVFIAMGTLVLMGTAMGHTGHNHGSPAPSPHSGAGGSSVASMSPSVLSAVCVSLAFFLSFFLLGK